MGKDCINIISMHSARRGLEELARNHRSSYLQKLIEGASPDICFMPGDNGKCLEENVVVGYEQYRTPNQENTVLLYDTNRVTMERPDISFSTFGALKGLDIDKLVSPMVQIQSLKPTKSVVKEFVMVSWERDLFSFEINEDFTVLKSLVIFSQRFASASNKPVFIGGEIPLSFENVRSIVKECSKDAKFEFMSKAQENLGPIGYLPSMTSGSTTSLRHKFMLEVFRCRSNLTHSEPVADCFIASKELQVTEATILNVENVLGKQIKMETLKKCAPVQTEIKYENRPPRHYGG